MEIHHIGDSSDSNIENAIPLCFECHAEVALYNPSHPKGRKFRAEELKLHRDQWFEICKGSAPMLASSPLRTDVGPIESLVTELEYNLSVAVSFDRNNKGAMYEGSQFQRCITEGVFSFIEESLKQSIFTVYRKAAEANYFIERIHVGGYSHSVSGGREDPTERACSLAEELKEEIDSVVAELRKFLEGNGESV